MYLRAIKRDYDKDFKDEYPFNIPIIKNFDEIRFNKAVTFFSGENGSGKSTLLEAIAIGLRINPEGGSQNFNFSTKNTHSNLHEYIILEKSFELPKTKYFLRAESFYNVATELDKLIDEGNGAAKASHGGKSLHDNSHGESFMQLIRNRFWGNGLYILDEPEAALSPQSQMQLLVLIDNLVKDGAQFIIATHSPILLSYPNSDIYDLDNNLKIVNYKDTENFKLYELFINNSEMMLDKLLDN